MRLVNYRVMRKDGTEFCTTNYGQATSDGNRIVETFFTKKEYLTEKERLYAEKVQKIYLDSFKQREREGD